MRSFYKWATVGAHWVRLSDNRPSVSPLWDTLIENAKVSKRRGVITIEGDKALFDLDFEARFSGFEKFAEPVKKTFFGTRYIPSGWAELKARTRIRHTFYHLAGLVESEEGISFRWAE